VDIDGFADVATTANFGTGEIDEDGRWADEEPDEDREGWKMKVWIEDDGDY
jgi:hypothetical protein